MCKHINKQICGYWGGVKRVKRVCVLGCKHTLQGFRQTPKTIHGVKGGAVSWGVSTPYIVFAGQNA
jgi:hypothetical protein